MKFSEWKRMRDEVAGELDQLRAGRFDRESFWANMRRERAADDLATRYVMISDRAYASCRVTRAGVAGVMLTRLDSGDLREISATFGRDSNQGMAERGFTDAEISAGALALQSVRRWISGDGDLPDGVPYATARSPWVR